jgi:hypothetical protein
VKQHVSFLRLEEPNQRMALQATYGNMLGWMRNRIARGETPYPDTQIAEKVLANSWLRRAAYLHLYLHEQHLMLFHKGIVKRCAAPWVANVRSHGCWAPIACPWCRYRMVLKLADRLGSLVTPQYCYLTSVTTLESDHLEPLLRRLQGERRTITKNLRRLDCRPIATLVSVQPQEQGWELHGAILMPGLPRWTPQSTGELWKLQHGPPVELLRPMLEYPMLGLFKPDERLAPLSRLRRVRTFSSEMD